MYLRGTISRAYNSLERSTGFSPSGCLCKDKRGSGSSFGELWGVIFDMEVHIAPFIKTVAFTEDRWGIHMWGPKGVDSGLAVCHTKA